jgi:hypothetical protein
MTTLATLHNAVPVLGIAALLLIPALGSLWLIRWTLRTSASRVRRIAFALVIALASLPVWAWALLYLLMGWATIGCGPDAYECPT